MATGLLIEGLMWPGMIATVVGAVGIAFAIKFSPAVTAAMDRLARWH